jgi:hypothetical protein
MIPAMGTTPSGSAVQTDRAQSGAATLAALAFSGVMALAGEPPPRNIAATATAAFPSVRVFMVHLFGDDRTIKQEADITTFEDSVVFPNNATTCQNKAVISAGFRAFGWHDIGVRPTLPKRLTEGLAELWPPIAGWVGGARGGAPPCRCTAYGIVVPSRLAAAAITTRAHYSVLH